MVQVATEDRMRTCRVSVPTAFMILIHPSTRFHASFHSSLPSAQPSNSAKGCKMNTFKFNSASIGLISFSVTRQSVS